jgi:hypothetical protein
MAGLQPVRARMAPAEPANNIADDRSIWRGRDSCDRSFIFPLWECTAHFREGSTISSPKRCSSLGETGPQKGTRPSIYTRRLEPFEVAVDEELFRISERDQPSRAVSYDFTWLNGPADGFCGFTVSRVVAASGDNAVQPATRMTRDDLVQEVRNFVEGFYEPGGIAEDFPDHVSARTRWLEGR